MGYKVKLSQFEGPFDLLVYLIEHAKMNIYDIRVSEITTQYLAYIEQMKQQDITVGSEFMVFAAELIELKSRMLLPRPKVVDGQEEMEDPRTELVQKILEYKKFKEAAAQLAEREELLSHIYTKPQEDLAEYTKEPDEVLNMDLNQFVKAFNLFLIKKRRLEEVRKTYARVERQRMTIENRIQQMRDCLLSKERLTFKELLMGMTSRYDVVVTFMSLLELLKQHTVVAEQDVRYGEITVTLADPEAASPAEPGAAGEGLPEEAQEERDDQ